MASASAPSWVPWRRRSPSTTATQWSVVVRAELERRLEARHGHLECSDRSEEAGDVVGGCVQPPATPTGGGGFAGVHVAGEYRPRVVLLVDDLWPAGGGHGGVVPRRPARLLGVPRGADVGLQAVEDDGGGCTADQEGKVRVAARQVADEGPVRATVPVQEDRQVGQRGSAVGAGSCQGGAGCRSMTENTSASPGARNLGETYICYSCTPQNRIAASARPWAAAMSSLTGTNSSTAWARRTSPGP